MIHAFFSVVPGGAVCNGVSADIGDLLIRGMFVSDGRESHFTAGSRLRSWVSVRIEYSGRRNPGKRFDKTRLRMHATNANPVIQTARNSPVTTNGTMTTRPALQLSSGLRFGVCCATTRLTSVVRTLSAPSKTHTLNSARLTAFALQCRTSELGF
jgi:hypothetical protein